MPTHGENMKALVIDTSRIVAPFGDPAHRLPVLGLELAEIQTKLTGIFEEFNQLSVVAQNRNNAASGPSVLNMLQARSVNRPVPGTPSEMQVDGGQHQQGL